MTGNRKALEEGIPCSSKEKVLYSSIPYNFQPSNSYLLISIHVRNLYILAIALDYSYAIATDFSFVVRRVYSVPLQG